MGNTDNPQIPDALLDATDPGWIGGKLITGEAILRFDFENKVASKGYTIRVWFDDGTWLDISVDGNEDKGKGGRTVKTDTTTIASEEENETNVDVTRVETYPNPFVTELNLSIDIAYEAIVRLRLFNMEGKLIMTFEDTAVKVGSNTITLPIDDHVVKALYVISIDTGREEIRKKVLSSKN